MPLSISEDIASLIVDAIADDYLDEASVDDLVEASVDAKITALYSCALVCQNFLRRARFHLYNHVTLTRECRLVSFAYTVAQSPAVASLVENLHIKLSEGVADEDIPVLSLAASLMVNLKTLGLANRRPSGPLASLRKSLYIFQVCSSIQAIHLVSWHFSSYLELADVLRPFDHLRRLHLSYTHVDHPRLSALCGDRLPLESVTLNLNTYINHSLPLFGSRIREMSIFPSEESPSTTTGCSWKDIAGFTDLQTLRIHTYNLEWATFNVLAHVRAKDLQELMLTYHVDTYGPEFTLNGILPQLDITLSYPSFSALKKFILHVHTFDPTFDPIDESWEKDWGTMFDKYLPRCRQRGILEFHFRVEFEAVVIVVAMNGDLRYKPLRPRIQ